MLHSPFRICEFDYVYTNSLGVISERHHGQTRCFDENLGNGVKLRMMEIPEGDFVMGSPETEVGRKTDEGPQHKVHVSRFFMGEMEVSERQYEAMLARPKVHRKMVGSGSALLGKTRPDIAAGQVRWEWAMEFCARLQAFTGKAYRLPSEAEWEYAARAGTTTAYTFGPVFTPDLVNQFRFRVGASSSYPGEYTISEGGISGPANGFGLYDMEGNVAEWVLDDYHPTYEGAPTDGRPWLDPDDSDGMSRKKKRIERGGAQGWKGEWFRSAARSSATDDVWGDGDGFRVALTLPSD